MSPTELLAYFDRISEAPGAVPRLRRFVLDLAVRGKLVERDPRDEPAVELLKRIQEAQVSMLTTKELKRLDSLRPIQPDEIDFPVPRGWETRRMAFLARKLGAGSTPLGGKTVYQTEGVPFLRSQNVRNDGLRIEDVARVPRHIHERMAGTHVQADDILFNITGASIGRCALVPDDFVEGNVSQHVAIIRRFVPEIRSFVHLSLISPFFQSLIDQVQVGVSREGLSMDRLRLFPMFVPPLAEQRRIVAKVDELMTLCDRLEAAQAERERRRDRLVTASLRGMTSLGEWSDNGAPPIGALASVVVRTDHITGLRQSIVGLAVRGRLVHQYSRDESPTVLFDRLRVALAKTVATGAVRARKEITPADGVLAGQCPSSWVITNFDSVNAIVSGVAKGRNLRGRSTIRYPYLRVANVQRGYLDLRVIKELEIAEDEFARYSLQRGDVLMTEGGDWDKLGRAAIWNGEIPQCIHQNHIYRIRSADADDLLPEWIALFANSPIGRSYLEEASKQTTNLASINMTQLRSCPLPLPPTAEQHRIVARVEELMAICDKLETQLDTAQTESRRLLEAVLHRALAVA